MSSTGRHARPGRPAGPAAAAALALGVVAALVVGVAAAFSAGGADPAGSARTGGRAQPPPVGTPPSAATSATPGADPAAPTGWGPTEGELARARELVAAMPVPAQATTVLMPGFWGHDAARPTPAEAARNRAMHGADTAEQVVTRNRFGGVFLRPEVVADAEQVRRLADRLHAAGDEPDGLPLLVSLDQEGGVVQRLRVGVDPVPSAASVGATGDPAYATRVARDNGRTLRRLGVTMVLAPVADVDPDGTSVLGSRTYARDRRVAAAMVTATVRGYLKAGVLPVVKHFPGLGSVTGDSHHELPVQDKSLARLLRTDLVPFAAAIEAGAPVVMTGHVAVRAIEPGLPGSISPGVVQGLLRDRLGFQGVAVTDSQGMGPINGPYNSAEGAVRSLLAGDDLVLNSPYPARARRALVQAVADGRLPAARLAEAATRVLALRAYQRRLASSAG